MVVVAFGSLASIINVCFKSALSKLLWALLPEKGTPSQAVKPIVALIKDIVTNNLLLDTIVYFLFLCLSCTCLTFFEHPVTPYYY